MIEAFIQKAGILANIAGAMSVISGLALIIFFAGVRFFGPINDLTGVILFLLFIPIALALHRIFQTAFPLLSLIATVIGIAAMLIFAILQLALVFGMVRFEQSLPYVLLTSGLVGIWLFANGVLSMQSGNFPIGFSWLGIVAGLGLIVTLIAFWIGGQQHPLTAIGYFVSLFAMPVWCFWLARVFNASTLSLGA